jgi:hypothetical protein
MVLYAIESGAGVAFTCDVDSVSGVYAWVREWMQGWLDASSELLLSRGELSGCLGVEP